MTGRAGIAETQHSFRAMGSPVTVRVVDPASTAGAAMAAVEQHFRDVERECTRFDSQSDLMRANAAGSDWAVVGPHCWQAMRGAFDAYAETEGAFDPRVLTSLVALGYSAGDTFGSGPVDVSDVDAPTPVRTAWTPEFDEASSRVRVGELPLDLGGIGKGLAVRGAREILRSAQAGRAMLVEAGGDLATVGDGPHREPGESRAWRVAVESPFGGSGSAAVLDASDAAVATSSIRLRSWKAAGRDVHHLIDPRTGEPAQGGIASVTVIADDPAWAEVWTKVLFLQGSARAGEFARARGLAALWIDVDGTVHVSGAMAPRVLWKVPRVQ
ncbi:MAG: FAD:protein FMN transferase [bacterium]